MLFPLGRAGEGLGKDWEAFEDKQEPLDIHSELMKLTLTIATKALFSKDISHHFDVIRDSFSILFNITIKRIHRLFNFPLKIPTPMNRRFRSALSKLDLIIYELISERRKIASDAYDDVLTVLLDAKEEGKWAWLNRSRNKR